MKLSIHLLTWNGAQYVPYLFESLRNQTYKEWDLLILDNASEDDTVEKIKKEMDTLGVPVKLVENATNKGFVGGHNQLFQIISSAPSDYVLLLNQDIYLEPDCLLKLVLFMNEHPDVAVIAPRLMKWEFDDVQHKGLENSFTDQIDSLGLKIFRSRRVVEKYAGKLWSVVKPKMQVSFRADSFVGGTVLEVFGVSGALPLFRRSALQAVAFTDGTFFDELYHSYKEDVDLALRLRSIGYKAYTHLEAVAYHDRSAAGPAQMDDAAAIDNKKKQSPWVKYNSYKNHLMTLYKNEYWQNVALDFPWILWYELKKFVWFLLFEASVLRGVGEIWKQRKELGEKRVFIKDRQRVLWKAIRNWWT